VNCRCLVVVLMLCLPVFLLLRCFQCVTCPNFVVLVMVAGCQSVVRWELDEFASLLLDCQKAGAFALNSIICQLLTPSARYLIFTRQKPGNTRRVWAII
jgi:hypothetical protein